MTIRGRLWTAMGIFLLVSAVYIAAGPGRIDIIDGQYRFEVASNIVDDASIQIRDPFLGFAARGIAGAYSPYGLSSSIAALPLLWVADRLGPPSKDRRQFFFSFTSAVYGAATAALIFWFLTSLRIAPGHALFWTMVSAFATLTFPVATSTFDQVQQGFFLLLACFLAFQAARRDSMVLASLSGAALAVLVNYQETYAILIPLVALAALAESQATGEQRRRGIERAVVAAVVGGFGVVFWMSLNNFRFGSLLNSGKPAGGHPPPLGNPLIGLPELLFSPGKSIFLYSPPTAFAMYGLWRLSRSYGRLGLAVVASSTAYVLMVSSLTFFGGDWCWGPRYFASVLPLIALGFPFVRPQRPFFQVALATTIVTGLGVQALALSIDHHRFFYARSLPTFFWYYDKEFYWHDSALFARPAEIAESIRSGVPKEAAAFRPGPYSALLTYAVFGGWGHPDLRPPSWMRHYAVFWLPRPWPLWMATIPAEQLPVHPRRIEIAVALLATFGMSAICIAGPWSRARRA